MRDALRVWVNQRVLVHLKAFIDWAGWLGALLILGAYGLISSGKLEPRSSIYQWMNILGAVGLLVNAGWNGAWPSAGLNIVWLAIAIHALRRRALAKGR
jgi:hypothetical protein